VTSGRVAWQRLADPRVITWATFLLTWVIFLLDDLVDVRIARSIDAATIAGLTAAQILTFAILALARLLYLRTAFARRHPLVMVLSIMGATLVGVTFGVIVEVLVDPASQIGDLAIDTIIFRVVVIALVGIAVVSWRNYRTSMDQLRVVQEQLQQARREGEQRYIDERRGIVERVTAMLETTLQSLQSEGPEESRRALRVTAQDVVRPLSHELATTMPDFAAPEVEASAPRRHIVVQVTSTPLISPLFMALAVTALATRLTVAAPTEEMTGSDGPAVTVDVPSLVTSLTFLGILFVAVWLSAFAVARLTSHWLPRLGLGGRIALLIGGVLTVIAVTGAVIAGDQLLTGRGVGVAALSFVAALPILVVAIVLAFIRVTSALWSSNVAELQSTNDELNWEVTRIRESLWQQQKALARAMHGPLKNAIHAGSLQLATGTGDEATLQQIRQGITQALGQIAQGGQDGVDLPEQVAELQRTWAGVCDVQVQIDAQVAHRLAVDQTTAVTALDIVGEAVANAAIHAGAPHTWIALRPSGARSLEITVRDDGQTQPGASSQPGLGSAILDEVCLDWDLRPLNQGSELRAVVPLR